jgi:putative FmdB family regulatory protein
LPVYEYRCNQCGHHFERSQRMSDEPVRECEVCGGEVARVLFAPAIHFKGTGFHNTDYGTRKRPKDGEGSGSDSAADGGKGDGAAPAKAKEATPKDTAGRTTGP